MIRDFARFSIALATLVLCMTVSPAVAQVEETPDTTGAASAEGGQKQDVAPRVVVQMKDDGRFVMELMPDKAPKTCECVMNLVRKGFYNGMKFHRVESWLVQTGKTGDEYPTLEGEMFSQRISQKRGMVGMARLPNDYDSATTQFYILRERKPLLNGEYTIFARVIDGMDVVDGIKKGDEIESCTLVE